MAERAAHQATPTVVSIQVAKPKTYKDDQGVWHSGFYKLPVSGPVLVRRDGITGDGQADRRHHGGIDKAVLAYVADHYASWQVQLGMEDIPCGGFGENLSLGGIDEDEACLGDVWQVAEVQLQISQPRQPCWKLARRWNQTSLPKLVVQSRHTGWYFRVIREGSMMFPATMELIARPNPSWSIRACNDAFYDGEDRSKRELAGLAELSADWRRHLLSL